MSLKYAGKRDEKTAQAMGNSLPVSHKHAIEIANVIRKLPVKKAKQVLDNAISQKAPIPFRRFHGDVGHRKGPMAAGRYPFKASQEIIKLVKSAEANAKHKGLDESALIVEHISAHKGPGSYRYGRHRGRKAKRTHIMVILRELEQKKIKDTSKEKAKESLSSTNSDQQSSEKDPSKVLPAEKSVKSNAKSEKPKKDESAGKSASKNKPKEESVKAQSGKKQSRSSPKIPEKAENKEEEQ